MNKRTTTNPKRRVRPQPDQEALMSLDALAAKARYGGNPVHKRHPGNFGLTPPSAPRPDKTLCDGVHIFDRHIARNLLQEGIRRGMISVQERNGWPQNVWAVTEDDEPLEAQLDNEEIGSYHGYPMSPDEPLYKEILKRWEGQ
jgi:hypothetical protein